MPVENSEAEQQGAQQPKSPEKKSFLDRLGDKMNQLKHQIGGSFSTEQVGKNGNAFSDKAKQEASKRLGEFAPNTANAIDTRRQALEDAIKATE